MALRFMLQILVCWKIRESTGFLHIPSFSSTAVSRNIPVSTAITTPYTVKSQRFAAGSEDDDDHLEDDGGEEASSPSFEMDNATMKIDDGGSNLTDRFKYKVHALMGDYDPVEGVTDDEDQGGNIMKALITFPIQHVFDVVGRVSSADDTNDDDNNKDYADKVKTIVFDTTGDADIECEIIPRGKKFVKVQCKAMVESTTMINTIYEELGQMESTVMKF